MRREPDARIDLSLTLVPVSSWLFDAHMDSYARRTDTEAMHVTACHPAGFAGGSVCPALRIDAHG